MANSRSRRKGAAGDRSGAMIGTTTSADQVREAEKVVLDLFAAQSDRDAEDLVKELASAIKNPSIASLAVWELLDRGTLVFASGSRRRIRRAS